MLEVIEQQIPSICNNNYFAICYNNTGVEMFSFMRLVNKSVAIDLFSFKLNNFRKEDELWD